MFKSGLNLIGEKSKLILGSSMISMLITWSVMLGLITGTFIGT